MKNGKRDNGRHKLPAASPEVQAAVQAALARNAGHGPGAPGTAPTPGHSHDTLIPILSDVNRTLGFLSPEALAEVSRVLQTPASQVGAVATFYSMLATQPRGRHVVQFCESAPCHVVGGRQVWQALRNALQVEPGETTPDGRFTLVTTSCLGVCGVGPVLVIDDDVHGNLTPEQVPELLARYA